MKCDTHSEKCTNPESISVNFFTVNTLLSSTQLKKNPENYQPLRTLPSVTLAPSPQEYPVLLSNSSDTFAFLLKAFVCCGVWGGLWRLSRVAWDRFDARALVPCGALWSTSQDFQRPLQSASVIDGGGALVPAFSHLAPILLHWLFYILDCSTFHFLGSSGWLLPGFRLHSSSRVQLASSLSCPDFPTQSSFLPPSSSLLDKASEVVFMISF